MKEMAIETCDHIRKDTSAGRLKNLEPFSEDLGSYQARNYVNNLAILGWICHIALDQPRDAIRPDLMIEIRSDILEEIDGPLLVHGLQGFQSKPILIPRTSIHQPNADFLAEHYEIFRKAS
ncbi:MAG: hypothetical protein LAP85_28330 [Acidobacteriia bacterium]|nr:hypothetical protein [Terriglobia bacterium]